MLGLYSLCWDELPFTWKAIISCLSIVFLGFSISPFSIASSFVFRIDQEKACELEFTKKISNVSVMRMNQSYKAIDNIWQEWSDCSREIPEHPSFIDQFFARESGRTILFSKGNN